MAAGLLLGASAWMADAADQAPATSPPDAVPPAGEVRAPTVNAVWVEREFSFSYMGSGTYYSCDGLRHKLEYVLEQVGARDDVKISTSCIDGTGVDILPLARIRVAMPAEATPERLTALASEQTHRELVSRVQGKGAGVDVATAQFPAQLRRVKFDGLHDRVIEDGDCELLSQLLPQVLEPLGVRKVPGSKLQCVPRQSQVGSVRLELESLHAVPAAKLQ